MASQASSTRSRFQCDHGGCSRSYLRLEHLNRHRLTHKQSAFSCSFCKKPFTRNDLLQVHIRRHESPKNESFLEKPAKATPPPPRQNHWEDSVGRVKRTDAGWDSAARPFAPPGGIDFGSSLPLLPLDRNAPDLIAEAGPPGFPLERVIFGTHAEDMSRSQDNIPLDPNFLPDGFGLTNVDPHLLITEECYLNLLGEAGDLGISSFPNKSSLQMLFISGFKNLDTFMPLFHRPTFDLSVQPTLLTMAICCFGGVFSATLETREAVLKIYRHVREKLFHARAQEIVSTEHTNRSKDTLLGASNTKTDTLKAMLIIEHVGLYGLTLQEYEMSHVFHSITITAAQQSGLFAQSNIFLNDGNVSEEERWKSWVAQESMRRLVFGLFLNDVRYSIHFNRSPALSTSMMKAQLPGSQTLWHAKSAIIWSDEVGKRMPFSPTSQLLLEVLLGVRDPNPTYHKVVLEPGVLDILIHAVGSEVMNFKRTTPSASSRAIDILRKSDLMSGLARWKGHFDQLDAETLTHDVAAISARNTFHLVNILLHENIPDLLAVSGSGSLENNDLDIAVVGKEACIHALNIIRTCTEEPYSAQIWPLHQNRTLFIASLALIYYVSKVDRTPAKEVQRVSIQPESTGSDVSLLMSILEGRDRHLSMDFEDFETTKSTVNTIVKVVIDRLAADTGGTSRADSETLKRLLLDVS